MPRPRERKTVRFTDGNEELSAWTFPITCPPPSSTDFTSWTRTSYVHQRNNAYAISQDNLPSDRIISTVERKEDSASAEMFKSVIIGSRSDGRPLRQERFLKLNSGDYQTYEVTQWVYDAFERKRTRTVNGIVQEAWDYPAATATNTPVISAVTYSAPDGSRTTTEKDALGRKIKEIVADSSAATVYGVALPAQAAVEISWTYAPRTDASFPGYIVTRTEKAGAFNRVSVEEYDGAERLVRIQNPDGSCRAMAYGTAAGGGREEKTFVESTSGLLLSINTYHRDGTLLSKVETVGALSPTTTWTYTVPADYRQTTSRMMSGQLLDEETIDGLGRTVLSKTPVSCLADGTPVFFSSVSIYDGNGKLASISRPSPGGGSVYESWQQTPATGEVLSWTGLSPAYDLLQQTNERRSVSSYEFDATAPLTVDGSNVYLAWRSVATTLPLPASSGWEASPASISKTPLSARPVASSWLGHNANAIPRQYRNDGGTIYTEAREILWTGSILNTQRRVLRNGSQFRKVIARNGLEYAFTSPDAANCLLAYNGFREPLGEMSWESIPYWTKLDISPTTGQVMGRQLPNSSTYTAKYTYYTAAAGHQAGRLATSSSWTYPSNAALGTITYNYNERGQILSMTGNGTTPSAYDYDESGRTKTLTTWRGAAGDAATAQVTTWIYSSHPTLPLVRSKKYPGRPIGINYTYAADGSLATRDWERPDGSNRLRTTYSTNSFGQTTGVSYSNAAVTPPVAFAYDRAGRVRYRTDAAGTTLLEYRYDGTLLTETTVTAPNIDTPLAAGRHLRRTVDAFGRMTGLESAWGSTLGTVNVAGNGTVSPYVTYSYGTADRLSGIASGGMTGSIVRTSTTEAFQVTPQLNSFSQDYAYNRILRSSTTGQPSNHLAYVSGLGNLRNSNLTWDSDRLTSRGETDMNWNYAYDEKNQVKRAWKKFTASNSNAVVAGTQSQYAYDGIGNRTTLDEGGNGTTDSTTQPDWTQGLRQTKYFANELNQYTGIERPETFDVTGRRSNTNAAITVNGSGASYQGLYFRKEVANTPAPYTTGDTFEPVQVIEGTSNFLTLDPRAPFQTKA